MAAEDSGHPIARSDVVPATTATINGFFVLFQQPAQLIGELLRLMPRPTDQLTVEPVIGHVGTTTHHYSLHFLPTPMGIVVSVLVGWRSWHYARLWMSGRCSWLGVLEGGALGYLMIVPVGLLISIRNLKAGVAMLTVYGSIAAAAGCFTAVLLQVIGILILWLTHSLDRRPNIGAVSQ